MEEQDLALHAARKEYDDWSERDHRLNLNIETLRRALPRLLTKVTKITHPVPSVEQLQDAIHKLDDELGKLMKDTGTLLLKEVLLCTYSRVEILELPYLIQFVFSCVIII